MGGTNSARIMEANFFMEDAHNVQCSLLTQNQDQGSTSAIYIVLDKPSLPTSCQDASVQYELYLPSLTVRGLRTRATNRIHLYLNRKLNLVLYVVLCRLIWASIIMMIWCTAGLRTPSKRTTFSAEVQPLPGIYCIKQACFLTICGQAQAP